MMANPVSKFVVNVNAVHVRDRFVGKEERSDFRTELYIKS